MYWEYIVLNCWVSTHCTQHNMTGIQSYVHYDVIYIIPRFPPPLIEFISLDKIRKIRETHILIRFFDRTRSNARQQALVLTFSWKSQRRFTWRCHQIVVYHSGDIQKANKNISCCGSHNNSHSGCKSSQRCGTAASYGIVRNTHRLQPLSSSKINHPDCDAP